METKKRNNEVNFKHLGSLCVFFSLLLVSLFTYFKYEVKKARKLGKAYSRFFSMQEKNLSKSKPILGSLSIPRQLQNIPLADKEGIILDVKNINISGVEAPYNASIEKVDGKNLLFFRYDVLTYQETPPFHTHIGMCKLDNNFEQLGKEVHVINTQSQYSEDPRFIQVGDKNFIVYNDILKNSENPIRTIHLAELNPNTFEVNYITNLDIQLNSVEKNWSPFSYNENGKDQLFFEYYIRPHKILSLPNPKKNELVHKNYLNKPIFQNLPWKKTWGELRGGTPGKLVDGQYLSFFHSFFQDIDGYYWYVMGAYTFESKPPFNITSVSKYPILFEGIYNTLPINSSNPIKRSIYPAGFITGMQDGKEVIHVSCGENDSTVKIITFDKEKLLKSLKKINK